MTGCRSCRVDLAEINFYLHHEIYFIVLLYKKTFVAKWNTFHTKERTSNVVLSEKNNLTKLNKCDGI